MHRSHHYCTTHHSAWPCHCLVPIWVHKTVSTGNVHMCTCLSVSTGYSHTQHHFTGAVIMHPHVILLHPESSLDRLLRLGDNPSSPLQAHCLVLRSAPFCHHMIPHPMYQRKCILFMPKTLLSNSSSTSSHPLFYPSVPSVSGSTSMTSHNVQHLTHGTTNMIPSLSMWKSHSTQSQASSSVQNGRRPMGVLKPTKPSTFA